MNIRDQIMSQPPGQRVEHAIQLLEYHFEQPLDLKLKDRLKLSVSECKLLMALARRAPDIVTSDHLYSTLYFDAAGDGPAHTVIYGMVCSLRRKLARAGVRGKIFNERGVGYRLRGTIDATA